MQRVSVVGTTGSGKTTFAHSLAERLGVPCFEIDASHWGSGWTPRPTEERDRDLASTAAMETWIIDGNYKDVRDLIWARVDTVVWLDYSFTRTFWQLFRRTIARAVRHETLWAGNHESLRQTFLSRESILLWLLQTYHRRRRDYARVVADPRWAHITFVRLRSPRDSAAWLARVGDEANSSTVGEMRVTQRIE